MKRIRNLIGLGLVTIIAAGLAAPYVDAEGYRTRLQAALERALNRKVTIRKVHFNLFTGPGFTADAVVIADDPSIGLEPLAYVGTLEARVTLSTLWTRKLAFSNLKLIDPALNLVKTESGVWNFQLLRGVHGEFPTIQVRSGRINFKFGDTKSVFYLAGSDLDIYPLDENRLDIRFAGQPSRTDQSAQAFGQLLARGVYKRAASGEPEIEVNAELERGAISEIAKLLEGRGIGLHGVASAHARISGPVSRLAVTGQLKLEDVHRWDLMSKGGGWQLNYRGVLDLQNQRLELGTSEKDNPGAPLAIRLRASDWLSNPRWATTADLRDVPAAALLEAARHMGAALPADMTLDGKLNGAISFSRPGGFQGQLSASEATVQTPGAPLVKIRSSSVVLDGSRIVVGPGIAEAGEGRTAELSATYDLDLRSLEVTLSTAAMNAGELQKGTGLNIPLLGSFSQGSWRGRLGFTSSPEDDGTWSGEFEVHDARAEVPGLAAPVKIAAASVVMEKDRLAVTRIRAKAGLIDFGGEYRCFSAKPCRLKLSVPEAALPEIERLFLPTLRRTQGLLARFRLRNPITPSWLRERRLEGSVHVDRLTFGDQTWTTEIPRFDWNGTSVRFAGLTASHGDTELAADASIDLIASLPRFNVTGSADEIAFKGGILSLDGSLDSLGLSADVLANAKGEGTFDGQRLAFAPDAEFRTISGAFELSSGGKLRLKNVQAGQGFENYTGQGATQPDGRLVLDLVSGRRQVKFAGSLFGVDKPVR